MSKSRRRKQEAVFPTVVEYHTDGSPILRGRLTEAIPEHPGQYYFDIPCPNGGFHRDGWKCGLDFDRIEHRSSHCSGFSLDGYYIGLDRNADHFVPLKAGWQNGTC